MTVSEFTAAVKGELNVSGDDSTVSERLIFFIGKNVRSMLIRQEANKDVLLSGAYCDIIRNFELERSSISESKEFEANTIVFKSVKDLPSFTDTKFGKIILGIYFDNGVRLQKLEYADWRAAQKRRYPLPTKPPGFIIRDNRLYVFDYTSLADCIVLFIEAVLDDPEAQLEPCDYIGDMEFKMPSYLIDRTVQMTAEAIRRKYDIPADTKNNAREDITIVNP